MDPRTLLRELDGLTHPEIHAVDEALHRLWKEGAVEMECLVDGTLAYSFLRR